MSTVDELLGRHAPTPPPEPTAEQQAIIDAFATGDSFVVEAGAGTGKTTTLGMVARSTKRRGLYLAFNKALVVDAGSKMPSTTKCSTAHSLAYQAEGKRYRHRLDAPRMRSGDIARILGIGPCVVTLAGHRKTLAPWRLAGIVMRTITRFCQTADFDLDASHVPYLEGLDWGGSHDGNDAVAAHILPHARTAWADLCSIDGQLPFKHEHYLKCQPPGTLVTVVLRKGGTLGATEWADIPIENLQPGDQVVSWARETRLGRIRKTGRPVTHVGQRHYEGPMVTVSTATGRSSRYTPDHICVAMLGEPDGGNHVVYMMRRGHDYRIGRTPWRMKSQDNRLGPVHRALMQGADAIWVLSAHATDYDAALAEALAQNQHGVPGWQFRSRNEFMPLDAFWAKAGDNGEAAAATLTEHGRDIRYPLWVNDGRHYQRRPVEIRACNLMSGMRVCEVDAVTPGERGELVTGGWSGAWKPATVTTGFYAGPVHSIEVDQDHTYVADGIVTHNCYQLTDPKIAADFICFDEAQDASPILAWIVNRQTHAQVGWIGDSNQAIYEWTGAINAMQELREEVQPGRRLLLSQSWRFGQAIADAANGVLHRLDADLRLVGLPGHDSRVGHVLDSEVAAVLCRTNARAMHEVIAHVDRGRRPHLIGGGVEITNFARGASDLQGGRPSTHPDLACFDTWLEILEYVATDEQGGELALMVDLVKRFGAKRLMAILLPLPPEREADVVISTAHRAKGREWSTVRLAEDLEVEPDEDDLSAGVEPEELRLLYVAATRARDQLDPNGVTLSWPEYEPIDGEVA